MGNKSPKVLTPRMIRAAEAYIRGMSMREAMIKAGYTSDYASEPNHVACFLKSRQVIKYIRNRQQQIAEAESLDKSELVKMARAIIADGDPRDRSKALELLMRMGLPIDEKQIDASSVKAINITFGEARKITDDHT